MPKSARTALISGAAILLAGWPVAAQAPSGALGAVQTGLWQLRAIGGASQPANRTVCISNPRQMLQLHHGGRRCSPRVLNEEPNEIAVRYECRGGGWGQTSVRVETPRLATIDTQGIADGMPFHQIYEARHSGECG